MVFFFFFFFFEFVVEISRKKRNKPGRCWSSVSNIQTSDRSLGRIANLECRVVRGMTQSSHSDSEENVNDVVSGTATVWKPGVITSNNSERALAVARSGRNSGVQTQNVSKRRLRNGSTSTASDQSLRSHSWNTLKQHDAKIKTGIKGRCKRLTDRSQ